MTADKADDFDLMAFIETIAAEVERIKGLSEADLSKEIHDMKVMLLETTDDHCTETAILSQLERLYTGQRRWQLRKQRDASPI